MMIPNFENTKFVDRNGNLTAEWQLILQQLFTLLQTNLSNEGYKLPQQTTAIITSLNTAASIGNLIYDSTLDVAKVNLAGVYKTIQTL